MADIGHVIVLMLENRSFDCILGRLYPQDPDFRGLTLNESNHYGMTYGVWNDQQMTAATACIPDPDPGEGFQDMNVQLFGSAGRVPGASPDMSGFALNYATSPEVVGYRDPGAVMHRRPLPLLRTISGRCSYRGAAGVQLHRAAVFHGFTVEPHPERSASASQRIVR